MQVFNLNAKKKKINSKNTLNAKHVQKQQIKVKCCKFKSLIKKENI